MVFNDQYGISSVKVYDNLFISGSFFYKPHVAIGVKKVIYFLLLIITVLITPSSLPHAAPSAKTLYFKGEACYLKLQRHPEKKKYRHHWTPCIKPFQLAIKTLENDAWAPANMYMYGFLHYQLYLYSHLPGDKKNAIAALENLQTRYPKSLYKKKAADTLTTIIGKKKKKGSKEQSKTSIGVKKRKKVPLKGPPVAVTDLRYLIKKKNIRIFIDTEQPVYYTHRLLNPDPQLHSPHRLYVDIQHAKISPHVEGRRAINSKHLFLIRSGQFSPQIVRIVFDLNESYDYEIRSLKHPFRIVLDIHQKSKIKKSDDTFKRGENAIDLTFKKGRPTIVIDPGHGGKDHGSIGLKSNIYEKDIVLGMALKLYELLDRKNRYNLILTRDSDNFLSLEERIAIANTMRADLFISLHANASDNPKHYGIETYFLSIATHAKTIKVAARENVTSLKNISDLQDILSKIISNSQIASSKKFASIIQKNLCTHLKQKYKKIKNNGTQQAPFYILIGAEMPAILIQTSYLTHPREFKRLNQTDYQREICKGILKGIERYLKTSKKQRESITSLRN